MLTTSLCVSNTTNSHYAATELPATRLIRPRSPMPLTFKNSSDCRLLRQEGDEDHQTFAAEKHLRDQAYFDNKRKPASIEIENIHALTECFNPEDALLF